MADVFTDKAAIDAVSMEIILSIVQEELIQKAILAPTLTDYSAFAVAGSDKVKIPKAGSFVAEQKLGSTALNAQALTMLTDDLSLDQHYAVQTLVEDIAKLQANVDMFGEYLKRMASSLAKEMDEKLYAQLKLTSSAAPDHRIDWANAPTDTATKADFVAARKLLKTANVPLEDGNNFVAVNPKRESEMLSLTDFVDADKWLAGSADAKLNGVIGKVYGFQVLVTNVVEDDAVIFYHKSHVGYARQALPKYETMRDLAFLADRMSLAHLYGCKVLDSGKRGVLVGSTS